MSTESLFKKCKECDKTHSKSVKYCPFCGVKQKKYTWIKWVASLIIISYVIGGLINKDFNTVSEADVQQKKYNENLKADVREKLTLGFSWNKTGFESIMSANFSITNKSDIDIKDVVVNCIHYAHSGTEIDKNTKPIYEVIPANSVKYVNNFNMGFINSQVSKSSCYIEDFKINSRS
jgi:hypothetical protein